MELHQKIIAARKKKGLTQEQLADLTNITARTIQRIESGESMPRAYTLKAIAAALDSSFEELTSTPDAIPAKIIPPPFYNEEDSKHFLKILCLSCFSYLVLPFIHVLVPRYLLKRSNERNPAVIGFARKIIRVQLYWKFTLWFLMLITLAWNLGTASSFGRQYLVHYLIPFFAMYIVNAFIIAASLVRIDRTNFVFNASM